MAWDERKRRKILIQTSNHLNQRIGTTLQKKPLQNTLVEGFKILMAGNFELRAIDARRTENQAQKLKGWQFHHLPEN